MRMNLLWRPLIRIERRDCQADMRCNADGWSLKMTKVCWDRKVAKQRRDRRSERECDGRIAIESNTRSRSKASVRRLLPRVGATGLMTMGQKAR